MADEIDRYFNNIGRDLAAAMPDSLLEASYVLDEDRELFQLKEVAYDDVMKLLMKLSPNKSTGVDGIPIKFLKMTPVISARILTYIINLSIRMKIVPDGWKRAVLTPLYKDGDPNDPSNYHPIAIHHHRKY